MPTNSVMNTPTSLTKARSAETTTTLALSLAAALGLPDAGRAGVAALLVAAEEIERNSHFAARVRSAYDLLPDSKPARGSRGAAAGGDAAAKILSSTLTPIRHVEGREINLAAPLDPYFLLEVYGAGQLRQALDLFPLAKLKEGLPAVMERHPSTKPASKSSKAAVIDYLVRFWQAARQVVLANTVKAYAYDSKRPERVPTMKCWFSKHVGETTDWSALVRQKWNPSRRNLALLAIGVSCILAAALTVYASLGRSGLTGSTLFTFFLFMWGFSFVFVFLICLIAFSKRPVK